MAKAHEKTKPPTTFETDGQRLRRLQFELALELGDTGERPLEETFRQAAEAADGELLFVLPLPDGKGMTALVRLSHEGNDSLIQARTAPVGFDVSEEPNIDPALVGFARSSIDVLERLKADRAILEPLAAATH